MDISPISLQDGMETKRDYVYIYCNGHTRDIQTPGYDPDCIGHDRGVAWYYAFMADWRYALNKAISLKKHGYETGIVIIVEGYELELYRSVRRIARKRGINVKRLIRYR